MSTLFLELCVSRGLTTFLSRHCCRARVWVYLKVFQRALKMEFSGPLRQENPDWLWLGTVGCGLDKEITFSYERKGEYSCLGRQ